MSVTSVLACIIAPLLFGFLILAHRPNLARLGLGTAIKKFLAETPEVFYPARPATFLVSRYPSFAELDQPGYDEPRTNVTAPCPAGSEFGRCDLGVLIFIWRVVNKGNAFRVPVPRLFKPSTVISNRQLEFGSCDTAAFSGPDDTLYF